eukprot:364317-Chlamydomonas_euryale.AAC.2
MFRRLTPGPPHARPLAAAAAAATAPVGAAAAAATVMEAAAATSAPPRGARSFRERRCRCVCCGRSPGRHIRTLRVNGSCGCGAAKRCAAASGPRHTARQAAFPPMSTTAYACAASVAAAPSQGRAGVGALAR